MHSVLLILKIIGIVLAVLLGLLLLILLIVLFVPLRYRFSGYRRQEGGEMAAEGRVSWFLSLLSVRFGYEKEAFFQIRLLGIRLGRRKRREKEAAVAPEPRDASASEAVKRLKAVTRGGTAAEETPVRAYSVTEPEKAVPSSEPENIVLSEPEREASPEPVWKKIYGKIRNILRGLWERLKGIPARAGAIRRRLDRMRESLRRLREKALRWQDYLSSEEVRETIRLLWRQTKGLFHHILPRTVRIRGRFGFGDPALTGQVTGLMSMAPVFYGKDISLTPDFTEACLEGEFFFRGRIRAASLLMLALKIWFNKDFQKARKRLGTM